jgi:hypothetical protein
MKRVALMVLMALAACEPQLPACVHDCSVIQGLSGGDRGDTVREVYP